MQKTIPSKTPNSIKGITQLRLQDFKDIYEWQLEEYGDTKHKIITTIKVEEYYRLGTTCIENNITIASFIREAIRASIDDIAGIAKKIKKPTNKAVILKDRKGIPIHKKQGQLI